jgi:hypothetical protein
VPVVVARSNRVNCGARDTVTAKVVSQQPHVRKVWLNCKNAPIAPSQNAAAYRKQANIGADIDKHAAWHDERSQGRQNMRLEHLAALQLTKNEWVALGASADSYRADTFRHENHARLAESDDT